MLIFKKDMDIHKRLLYHAFVIPVLFLFLFWFVFFVELFSQTDFKVLGVFPLHFKGLLGIITMPFIHGDIKHLLANSVAFGVLSVLLFSNYRHVASKVFVYIWVISGLILWFIGRQNWHIGASSVVYGIAFFLFLSGLLLKKTPLVATSLVVVFLYGGMVWYMFPLGIDNHISWEGHLSGALVGTILAIYYKIIEPKEDPTEETEENDTVDYDWLENTNENSTKDDV
jgi:membrane associated rhomboid family serine protease